MPLLNQYAGHHKLDQTLFSRGVDFTNCNLFAPLWHPRSKVSPFISFDKTGHSITATGATWSWPYGYSLDPVDDFLTFGDTSTLAWMHGKGNISAFAWTVIWYGKLSSFGQHNKILDTSDGTTDVGVYMYTQTTTRTLNIWITNTGGNSICQATPGAKTFPADGAYHQVAMTYDQSLGSNNLAIYFDRVFVENKTKTANAPSNVNSWIAPKHGGILNGISSELFIYQQKVLSSTEIVQHYLAAKRRMPWANLP